MRYCSMLLVFSLVGSLTFAQAQAPDSLPYHVAQHLYYARYPQAIALANAAIEQRNSQPNTPTYANALAIAGQVWLTMNKFRLADSLLSAALALYEKNGTTADSNYIKACVWLSDVYQFSGKMKLAEGVLKKALSAAERCARTPHAIHQSTALKGLYSLDENMSRFDDAKEHYQQLIEFLEKNWGKKHPRVAFALIDCKSITILDYQTRENDLLRAKSILENHALQYPQEYATMVINLSDVYGNLSNFKKSEQLLLNCRDFVRKTLGTNHHQYAFVLRKLASFNQYYTVQFRASAGMYKEALRIYGQSFGEQYGPVIGTLRDLASWYSDLGFVDSASIYNQRAYQLIRLAYGDESASTVDLMLDVVSDYFFAGKQLEADLLLNLADTISQHINPNSSVLKVDILAQRAILKYWQGEYDFSKNIAEDAYQKQLELFRNAPYKKAKAMLQLAAKYGNSRFYVKSDSLYKAGLMALKAVVGEQSFDYVFELTQYCYTLEKLGEFNKVRQYQTQFVETIERIMGKENFWTITGLHGLSDIEIRQKNYVKAAILLEQNEATIKKVYGDTSKWMKSMLDNRLDLYEKTKTPIEQIALNRQLIELDRTLGNSFTFPIELGGLARKLYQAGEYVEAQQLVQEALIYTENNYGKKHVIFLFGLWSAVDISIATNNYPNAEAYLEEWKAIMSSMGNPADWEDYFKLTKSSYQQALGNYQEALQTYEEILRQPNHKMDVGDYNQWGVYLQDAENLSKADSVLRRGIQFAEQNGESVTTLYANLAVNLQGQGKYPEALNMYKKIFEASIKKEGYVSNSMGIQLRNFSTVLENLDRFQEAEDTLYRALDIFKKLSDDLNIADVLHSLHIVHSYQDRLDLAGKEIIEALDIVEKRLGSHHPQTLTFKQDLATHYANCDRFYAADSLFQLVIAARKLKTSISTASANAFLLYAVFLSTITGEYDQALQMMEQGLAITEKIYPAGGHNYQGEFYRRIGELFSFKHNYGRALEAYQKAEALYERFLGKDHTDFAFIQNKIGEVFRKLKDFSKAEVSFLKAIQIYEQKLGATQYNVAVPLEGLMRVYELKGNYVEAERLGERCLKIVEKSRGKNSAEYSKIAVRLASLLYRKADQTGANAYLAAAKNTIHTQTKQLFTQITPSRQSNILDRFAVLDCYPTLLEEYPNDTLAGMCFGNTLLVQGSILDNTRSLRQSILNTRDSSLQRLLDDYLAAEAILTDAQKNQAQEPAKIEIARQKVQTLEETLRRKSPDFEQYSKSFELSWRDVQRALKPDEAAVMYLSYKHYRVEQSDSVRYAAMVLRPGWAAPRFFPLVAESEIAKMVSDQANRSLNGVQNIYDLPSTQRSQSGTSVVKGPSIYQLIWAPLEQSLQGAKKVYFSSTGLLHRFNIGALPIKKGENGLPIRLQDRYDTLVQMRSLRHVLQSDVSRPASKNSKTALIAGRIDFGVPITMWDTLSDETPKCDTLLRIQNYKVNYLYAKNASTQNVIQALQKSPAPSIIHIATHGFFAPNLRKYNPIAIRIDSALSVDKKVRRNTSADPNRYLPKSWQYYPMMRSGLVLAGANTLDSANLQKGKNPYLLTAQDIAALNLKGTELVVLSACETGLGDVLNNEGVYGLQRAFLQAGAKQVIMSLWEVRSDVTTQFMGVFYENLSKGLSPRLALQVTQNEMRWTKKGNSTREESPYGWAAFILIE